jgi:signal recognition particle subunit SRP54
MIPGASKAMKDVEIEDDAFKHIEAIIHSMTPIERSKPALIDVKEGKNTRVLEPN